MWLDKILGNVTCAEAAAPGSKTARSKARKFTTTLLESNIRQIPPRLDRRSIFRKENVIRASLVSSASGPWLALAILHDLRAISPPPVRLRA
jgi:hypothetical protein